MNEGQDIYQFRSLFRSQKIVLTQEDQALIASLPQLTTRAQASEFSDVLLDLMSFHSICKKVVRVCLVRRLGFANQIEVISSKNSLKDPPNTMLPGYSCFVGHNGSLFSLSPGTLRSYNSASNIVDEFNSQGRPPQRSIKLIADMKFESGVVLPSFDDKERFVGALFFNFREKNVFVRDADCTLLSTFESQSRAKILERKADWLEPYTSLDLPWNGSSFSKQSIEAAIKQIDPNLEIAFDHQISPFLLSHGNIGCFFHQIAMLVNSKVLKIETVLSGPSVGFCFKNLTLSSFQLQFLHSLAHSIGGRLRQRDSELLLEMTYEPVLNDEIQYSLPFIDPLETKEKKKDLASIPAACEDPSKRRAAIGAGDKSDLMMLIVVNYLVGDVNNASICKLEDNLKAAFSQLNISGVSLQRSGIFMHLLEGQRSNCELLFSEWDKISQLGSTRYLAVNRINQNQFTAWQIDRSPSTKNDVGFINEILALSNNQSTSAAEVAMKLVRRYFEGQVS